jgi:hypothetical protein
MALKRVPTSSIIQSNSVLPSFSEIIAHPSALKKLRAGCTAEVEVHLPRNHKALSSSLNTTGKKNKERKKKK